MPEFCHFKTCPQKIDPLPFFAKCLQSTCLQCLQFDIRRRLQKCLVSLGGPEIVYSFSSPTPSLIPIDVTACWKFIKPAAQYYTLP